MSDANGRVRSERPSDGKRRSATGGVVLPGATLGVLGGGQLGRMFAFAALRLGFQVHVLTDAAGSPAAQVAQSVTVAAYDDVDAVGRFAAGVDALTLEFENISHLALESAEGQTLVRPGLKALATTQNRGREKAFLAQHGFPHATFAGPVDAGGLKAALTRVGLPCVVKSAGFGYDGKGQVVMTGPAELAGALALAADGPVVVEELVDLAAELSVVGARGHGGNTVTYPPFLNMHHEQILDLSLAPVGYGPAELRGTLWEGSSELLTPALLQEAQEIAKAVMAQLDFVGVACVEFFVDRSGRLLVNEVAPRPHNSGHLSIEAASTSQFEQQVRALAGLPLGSTALYRPAAMVNLLGDSWQSGLPNWAAALKQPGAALHLYGKETARAGRKMGHITVSAPSAELAQSRALAARRALDAGR